MLNAFTICISVTGVADYRQIRIGQFNSGHRRRNPAMKRIEGVDVEIVYNFSMTPDSRDYSYFIKIESIIFKICQCFFDGC